MTCLRSILLFRHHLLIGRLVRVSFMTMHFLLIRYEDLRRGNVNQTLKVIVYSIVIGFIFHLFICQITMNYTRLYVFIRNYTYCTWYCNAVPLHNGTFYNGHAFHFLYLMLVSSKKTNKWTINRLNEGTSFVVVSGHNSEMNSLQDL